jgi:hypothetical protein
MVARLLRCQKLNTSLTPSRHKNVHVLLFLPGIVQAVPGRTGKQEGGKQARFGGPQARVELQITIHDFLGKALALGKTERSPSLTRCKRVWDKDKRKKTPDCLSMTSNLSTTLPSATNFYISKHLASISARAVLVNSLIS